MAAAEVCNSLVFEAVSESSVSKLQSVILSYCRIEVLTSFAQLNEEGETPLVIAMKGDNIELIHQLVKFLRKSDRRIAQFCMMSETIEQLFLHDIPITKLLQYLTEDWSLDWLDYLAQVVFTSTTLSRPDKIISLELIGAFLPKSEGECRNVMLKCWREATTLRFLPADGEPILPKIPYVGVTSVASSVVFGTAVEVMSMEQLNLLQEHFEHDVVDLDVQVRRRCFVRMQRQSLLVIRRISNQANRGPSFYIQRLYEFCTDKIQDFFRIRDDRSTELKRIVINTFLLILEQLTGFDPKLLPHDSFDIFMKSLGFASRYLALLAKKPPGYPGREDLSHANLLAVTKFISTIAKRFPNPATISTIDYDDEGYIDVEALSETIAEMTDSPINNYYLGFADVVYDLVVVLACIPPQSNNQDKQQTEEHLSNYIRNYFAEGKYTALHVAIAGEMTENLEPLKLLIKLGADPNATDVFGETPLHILARRKMFCLDVNLPMFQALVDGGTHLDMESNNGDTVLDILKRNSKRKIDRGVAADAYFSSLINTVFPLSCYCARVIRRHRIRFDEDRLPLHLQKFVSRQR